MCKRLMGNLNLLGCVRSVYTHPSIFNYHPTKKHKVASSLPDIMKAMWFCLHNKLFLVALGNIPIEFPLHTAGGIPVPKKVSKNLIDIISKGEKKIKEKFEATLHESFPAFRAALLERLADDQEITDDNVTPL